MSISKFNSKLLIVSSLVLFALSGTSALKAMDQVYVQVDEPKRKTGDPVSRAVGTVASATVKLAGLVLGGPIYAVGAGVNYISAGLTHVSAGVAYLGEGLIHGSQSLGNTLEEYPRVTTTVVASAAAWAGVMYLKRRGLI